MITFLQHQAIDKQKWDSCIKECGNGMTYAYSWFLDIVSPGWAALVEDDYSAVFPLTQRKKFGIAYLFQPPFTQQLGLFSKNKITENSVQEFIQKIPSTFRLVEIQLNTANTSERKVKGLDIQKKITHHLDLSFDREKLFAGYSENLRRNLKKAQKAGIKIINLNGINEIIDLFRNNRGREIKNLGEEEYKTLVQLSEECAKRNSLELLGAQSPDGKLIAGAAFLHTHTGYIFLFSAVNSEARESGAMSALISQFVEQHCTENKILDFEGSMNPSLARFYKSFGSQEVVYLQIRKNTLPAFIRWFKN